MAKRQEIQEGSGERLNEEETQREEGAVLTILGG